MHFIDLSLIIGYLILMLGIGLHQSRHIKSMRDFSIAGRNYPTSVIVAAISATLIGGGATLGMAEKVFSVGWIFTLVFFGIFINKIIIAQVIAPRMQRFENMLSVGEMVESFYSKVGRISVGLSGTLMCIGILGSQISAMGYFIQFFLDISFVSSVLIGCGVVVIYSSLGGIRAVTATDIIQFIILIIAIPTLCSFSLEAVEGCEKLFSSLPKSHMTFLPEGENIWKYIGLMIIFAIPLLSPEVTQRLLMSKNTQQMASAMRITALIGIPFYCMIALIGFVAISQFPHISGNLIIPTLINEMLPVGLKGFTIAGMIAVIMSSADSYLNAASVTFVHDVIKPIFKEKVTLKLELNIVKIISLIFGIISIIMALIFDNIFDILLSSFSVWGPVVVIPLYAAIFNIRTSPKTFILSAASGLGCFILWKILDLEAVFGLGALVPSMLANGLMFTGIYLLCYKKISPPIQW